MIKFIEYTGRWPNLCRGQLILEIDGQKVTFGSEYDNKGDYESFWCSGGEVYYQDNDYQVYSGPWKVEKNELPAKYREYADEIAELMNDNIPWGCCGGCI